MMRFFLISLGCPKNLVDSERIIGQLGQDGMVLTDDRSHAQCVVLNTCGFIKPAIDESMQAIQKLVEWKKRRKSRRILVCGCLVNRMKSHLCRRFPQVDGWFEIEKEGEIAAAVGKGEPSILPEARFLTTPKHYAYLKIAEGCDNRCAYCTIPQIRGSLHSRTIESITDEAQALADMGARELILVAQDTANYGYDLYKKRRLVDLVKKISRIDGIRWIRLLYAHPAHIDERLVDEIGSNPRVCKYVDMPIQHINNRILRLMNRKYERKTVERLIDELRKIPGLAIRTTIMAGFPTETAGEFDELLGFVRAVGFDHAGFFPYYREEGRQQLICRKYHRMKELKECAAWLRFNSKT